MANTINKNINSGLLKFTFTDSDGDVFAYFRMNPADVKLAVRCDEVAEYFDKKSKETPEFLSASDLAKYSDELAEKLDYLLGYKASETLFGDFMSPVTILPDGNLFAFVVLETIGEAVGAETKKRKQKMQKATAKYTSKYTK